MQATSVWLAELANGAPVAKSSEEQHYLNLQVVLLRESSSNLPYT